MFLILSEMLSELQIQVIQLIVVFVFIVTLDVLLLITLKRIFPKVTLIVLSVVLLVLGLFDLTYAFYLVALIYMLCAMTFIFGNIVEFRWLISNAATPKDRRFQRDFRKIYDQEDLVNQLVSAVFSLSKTKTGALITIERTNQLTEFIKNGSPIDAPVSAPLLTTIFYNGTALHDGAVVIRDDTILAASVYFTPSTKALAGKVGSRHRAALGISEISDAVSIVVSEETGRISIAYRAALQPVSPEDFRKVLVDHLLTK